MLRAIPARGHCESGGGGGGYKCAVCYPIMGTTSAKTATEFAIGM